MALLAQPSQIDLELRARHLGRMAHTVAADEGATPVHIGLLGTPGVVQWADAFALSAPNQI
jgi:hypothetical protein